MEISFDQKDICRIKSIRLGGSGHGVVTKTAHKIMPGSLVVVSRLINIQPTLRKYQCAVQISPVGE